MWKSIPALRRTGVLFFLALFTLGSFLAAQSSASGSSAARAVRWYRSNSSGVAIEYVPSRLAALRNEYCLSVELAESDIIPDILGEYFVEDFTAELRILYKNREETRRQWIFRDSGRIVRLSSSGSLGFFTNKETDREIAEDDEAEEEISGFIEIRDDRGLIFRELQYEADGSLWEFFYFYNDRILTSAETWFKEALTMEEGSADELDESADENSGIDESGAADELDEAADENSGIDESDAADDLDESVDENSEVDESETAGKTEEVLKAERPMRSGFVLLFTDYYRYSRPGSLRAIERHVSGDAGTFNRIPFPRIGPFTSPVNEIVTPRIAYIPDFFSGVYTGMGERINYTIDSRGRILTEEWKNEDGELLGEMINTWEGDRLSSILWRSPNQRLLVEYEFDSQGNRIAERNYRQGVLERRVTSRGDLDIEEIYVNGRLMLRAVWEKGIKISEERITSQGVPR